MSTQITTSFVNQYSSNIQALVQQKGSKLRDLVGFESVRGKSLFIDQIGQVAAVKKRPGTPIRRSPTRPINAVI